MNHVNRVVLLRSVILFSVILFLLVTAQIAMADTLILPAELQEIGEEAFMGDTSIGEVIVREGTEIIGDYAFAGSSLSSIHLPSTLHSIGVDAFDGCTGLTVYAPSRSAPLDYARSKNISYITVLSDIDSAEAVISTNEEIALFSFIPSTDATYKFWSEGDSDTYGYLYDADMNVITSDDDSGEGFNFQITQELTAGKQYYYGAKYYYSYTGRFDVFLSVSKVSWSIADNVLTISGIGEMDDYFYDVIRDEKGISLPTNIMDQIIEKVLFVERKRRNH